MRLRHSLATAAIGMALAVVDGRAQPRTTTAPDGSQTSVPAAPRPEEPPAPAPVIVNVPGQGKPANGKAKAPIDIGNYHLDDYQTKRPSSQWDVRVHGPPPEHHVVQSGDTLWDISWFYFDDPWQWPKVWSFNPTITNPHWIYPNDLVRLYPKGVKPAVRKTTGPVDTGIGAGTGPGPGTGPGDGNGAQRPAPSYGASLRRTAFVDTERLKYAAKIVGSVDAKTMLSRGDSVYLSYPKKRPPKVGKSYTIYTVKQPVKHPKSKKVVGSYVRIVGQLKVVSVKKGKHARAVIEDSIDVVQRGQLAGPLKRRFASVTPRPNERNLQGTIVAMIERDELVGPGQAVFIDLGKKQKLRVGNRLYVVRRGDAYDRVMGPGHNIGQDDRRFPARAVAEVIVVDVGDAISLAIVTASVKEAGVGDLVLMQKSR